MKKFILAFLAVAMLALIVVYWLIPGTLVVSKTVKVNCVTEAAFRNLSSEQNWLKWWPGELSSNPSAAHGTTFQLGENKYSLTKKISNNFEVLISTGKETVSSQINLFSIARDSSLIRWQVSIPAGNNFFNRIAAYYRAVAVKKDMTAILGSMQNFLKDFRNVYGFTHIEGSTKDSVLITTKSFSAVQPSTEFVYAMIGKLKNFCATQGCNITGTPMLNVSRTEPSGYRVMVALPVNRMMQPRDSVEGTKMIPGKFIITEVVGGPQAVANMHQQILNYFQDFGRTAMAIHFEYLVTDRQQEKDSSKWITRIYAPVY